MSYHPRNCAFTLSRDHYRIYLWKPFQQYNPQPIYHLESEKVRLIYVTGAQASFFKWLHLNMQHIFYKHLKLRDIGRVSDRVAFKNRGTSCWNWIHQYFKVWNAMNGKLNTLKWKLLYTNGHFKYGSKSNKKSSRSHQKVINSHLANVRVLCHQVLIMTSFQVTISDVIYIKKTS